MSQWRRCKRQDFIRRLRKLGFEGPYSGKRHQFMVYKQHRLAIPSNAEYSVPHLGLGALKGNIDRLTTLVEIHQPGHFPHRHLSLKGDFGQESNLLLGYFLLRGYPQLLDVLDRYPWEIVFHRPLLLLFCPGNLPRLTLTHSWSLTPHLDRYAEGVDIGHIVSTPSALPCLAKTGIRNGKLLFTSDSEHLGPTCGAHTLSRRLTILHGYRLSILHLPLGTAFHTVCLHCLPPVFVESIDYPPPKCQYPLKVIMPF